MLNFTYRTVFSLLFYFTFFFCLIASPHHSLFKNYSHSEKIKRSHTRYFSARASVCFIQSAVEFEWFHVLRLFFLSKEKLKLLLLFALKFIEIQHEKWEREIFQWLSCRCWNSIDCGCWLKRFETFHANVHMMLGSQARPPRRLFLFLLFETFPIMYGTQWSLAVEARERERSTWEMESNLMKSINLLKINSISPFSSTLCCTSNEECFDVPSMDCSHTIDINLFRKVSRTEEKKHPKWRALMNFFKLTFNVRKQIVFQ